MIPVNPPGNPPPPILPRSNRKLKFLDIDPLELARQLSLVESKLFCQIQANECLGKAWPKEFAKEGTPHIKAMIDMSNSVCFLSHIALFLLLDFEADYLIDW